MKCRRCGSEDVKVEFIQEQTIKKKRKGLLYWIFIGWWWEPISWIFLTLPKLIWELLKPRKYKIETKTEKMAVCQSCGKTWRV